MLIVLLLSFFIPLQGAANKGVRFTLPPAAGAGGRLERVLPPPGYVPAYGRALPPLPPRKSAVAAACALAAAVSAGKPLPTDATDRGPRERTPLGIGEHKESKSSESMPERRDGPAAGGAGTSGVVVREDSSDEKWTPHKAACMMVKQVVVVAILDKGDAAGQAALYDFFLKELKAYGEKYDDNCWYVLPHFQESISALLTFNDGTPQYFCPPHYERLRHLRKVFDNRFFNEGEVERKRAAKTYDGVDEEVARLRRDFHTRDFLIGRWHDDVIDDLFIDDLNAAIPEVEASESRWSGTFFGKKIGDCWLYYLSLIAPSSIFFKEERLPEHDHAAFKLGGALALLMWYRAHVDGETPLSFVLPSA